MWGVSWVLALSSLPLWCAPVPPPADWVPARWPWGDAQSLDLLSGGPVNCLLLKRYTADFVAAATARGVATLAILTPGSDVADSARHALAAKVTGVALEGEFPESLLAAVRESAGGAPVIEIAPRSRLLHEPGALVLATDEAMWPGISQPEGGVARAGPTSSAWIDTNTGFIRALRAWSEVPLWIANEPPLKTAITAARYLQAIADAGISGARWVLSPDSDFAARLARRETAAVSDWRRMLALSLLSGGILDMIAVGHTPVRPIPPQRLTPEALKDASMAVNLDADALTPEEKDILRQFARAGGTLLSSPPGWKDQPPRPGRITLEKAELERLNDVWRDVNSMVGRKNLGVRLFNASSLLSNLLVSADGKTAVLHLANYSDYPVENVTVHFTDAYKRATWIDPEGTKKALEIYKTDEGWGADIDRVAACASIILER
ncbi:MAG: hypothetical protein LAQ30_32870 [Acidobacteriia bacterium]|nr:hypothetical protein [Terriglobia bacterium]